MTPNGPNMGYRLIEKLDVLNIAAPGATLLVNSPFGSQDLWERLPRAAQDRIIDRGLHVWTIDADRVARDAGLGSRTNSVLQTCFFAVSGVLPRATAIDKIKAAIEKTYHAKGAEVVQRNFDAVDRALAALEEVPVPRAASGSRRRLPIVAAGPPPSAGTSSRRCSRGAATTCR